MSVTGDPLYDAILKYMPVIAGSGIAIVAGIAMMMDDAKDFGKTDRITHHVNYGIITLVGGLVALGVALIKIAGEGGLLPRMVNKNTQSHPQAHSGTTAVTPPHPKAPEKPKMMEYSPEIIESLK